MKVRIKSFRNIVDIYFNNSKQYFNKKQCIKQTFYLSVGISFKIFMSK
jgi:hypothetical protein